ncbi:DUF1206 domain-containing protein [Sphingopyxis sp. BSNA05]|uniref:DUF1206 domain-containing protein n=1 Tax=Sphingomonadales TaxID=204457 RepID=UPI000C1DCFCC|nr:MULTISPECIES: DUF1206 domain-containing protein [Sphingomonadaceae]ATW03168.1 hypothetical protein CHN51_06140 [Sphingorhabdus sp. YGSMI21]NRD88947.1 DUF1206 domain-containing protein [Sphingopyxis sp. BSNA05]
MSRVTNIENFARAGYLGRAVVYGLAGYLTLTTAGSTGTTGVLEEIETMSAGAILLALVGLGLLGYGIFRLYGAAMDLQGNGTDAKGLAIRIGHAASGLAHIFLCYLAFKAVLGWPSGSTGDGESAGQAAGTLASMPMGDVLLGVIGIGFIAAAINQAVKAYTAKFMGLLDADAPALAKYVGQAGYAARAVIFAVLGWQITSAALSGDTGNVGGVGQVLDSLRSTNWLYIAVAIGLLLFGLFSLVMARYRRIRNEDVLERLKS